MIPKKQFLVDVDGTIVLHDYPHIHQEVPDAVRVLRRMQEAGHTLILHTMRDRDELSQIRAWLKDRDLHFDHFNCNPTFETGSRKIYGHYSIDDHNLGGPMIHDMRIHPKPFIDWITVEKILINKGLL